MPTRPGVWAWGGTAALLGGLLLAAAGRAPAGADAAPPAPQGTAPELLQELKTYPHRLVYESFHDDHFKLSVANADGSHAAILTTTPEVDELYPRVSPDGKLLCFCVDEGKGRAKVRNLYLMSMDGTGRRKIADNAREPCWKRDGTAIGFTRGEYRSYTAQDFATKGIFIYDLKTGETRAHPNSKIEHLYRLNWSPDGNWFVATVHGGMGFSHSILALAANDDRVFDLHLGGCRPDISRDGKRVVWGNGDWDIGMADLDLAAEDAPTTKFLRNVVQSKDPMKTYHAQWSPDGRYIAFSYGDKLEEGRNLGGVPEMSGIRAEGWNICVADATKTNRWVAITVDGASNKQPDWVLAPAEAGK